ncbi:RNA-directed DNA polymerase, eukaryota [Tanacetum coccineum]
MRVVSWNTRGFGSKKKVLNEVWKDCPFNGVQVASLGRFGGLVSLLREDSFNLIDHWQCQNWIATILKFIPSDIDVLIISVYAPQQENEKQAIWQ